MYHYLWQSMHQLWLKQILSKCRYRLASQYASINPLRRLVWPPTTHSTHKWIHLLGVDFAIFSHRMDKDFPLSLIQTRASVTNDTCSHPWRRRELLPRENVNFLNQPLHQLTVRVFTLASRKVLTAHRGTENYSLFCAALDWPRKPVNISHTKGMIREYMAFSMDYIPTKRRFYFWPYYPFPLSSFCFMVHGQDQEQQTDWMGRRGWRTWGRRKLWSKRLHIVLVT